MFREFSLGRQRLVLTQKGYSSLVGKQLAPRVRQQEPESTGPEQQEPKPTGKVDVSATSAAIHDGFEQCFGETLVHAPLLDSILLYLDATKATRDLQAAALVEQVGEWLQQGRLVEIESGMPLRHAALVRLEPDRDVVAQVLHTSSGERRESSKRE